MNAETLASIQETVVSTATDLGIKVLAAIAFWVIGRWLIGVAGIAIGAADHRAAMQLLREKVGAIPNMLSQPAVDVEILDFTLVGPVLAVRPYCNNDHYWQVYFDTNRVIREALAEAGFPAPMPAQNVIVTQAA